MKYALIIGSNKYDDPKLAQLKTPAADSQALAKVLGDARIGGFDEVMPLINQSESQVRRSISSFLTDKKPDDLVMLYFSGHGVLDDRGRLYLALRDTQVNLLKATSIPSSFVADEMDSCRSKRQILVLDCCHSGAFERGTKGDQKAITETTFEGSGFGRVVLTASDSTQYALEGDQVIKQTELSLFTHFLLEGLKTGEADTNNDGLISLDEWYDYTYTKVISETPRQVPHKWSYNQQGDLVIARNPFLKKRVVELPYELLQALDSSFVGIRESAVNELGKYLQSRDAEMAQLAKSSLEKMKTDDSRRISMLAEKLLSDFEQSPAPAVKADPPPSKPVAAPRTEAAINFEREMPSLLQMNVPAEAVQKRWAAHPKTDKNGRSFWLKWLGTTAFAIVLLSGLYYYAAQIADSNDVVGMLLGVFAAGLTGLAQYFFFQDRLKISWIGTNAAAGLILASLHRYLFDHLSEWQVGQLKIILAFWLIGNFVIGLILVRKAQQNTRNIPAILNLGARQNVFLFFLSIFLAFDAFDIFMNTANDTGLFSAPDWLLNAAWVLVGLISIVAGISFLRARNTPRSFGFVTLVIFLFLNGIIVEILAINPEFPLYFLFIIGAVAFLSGTFFLFQKETWRNFSFIMLGGYLVSTGLTGMTFDNSETAIIFIMISILFAIPASISFFIRKP